MKEQLKVVTSYIYPPIPLRDCDWLACFDGQEEDGPQGWGRTEGEAIYDLTTNYELKDDEEIVLPVCKGTQNASTSGRRSS